MEALNELTCSELRSCLVCEGARLDPWLDLGAMPLANEYISAPTKQEHYPLVAVRCADCGHCQLTVSVSPKILFGDYHYQSGISLPFVEHCRSFAHSIQSLTKPDPSGLVVDIGSNDGTLLSCFENVRVLGVDPATTVATIAEQRGIPTKVALWNLQTANEIRSSHGQAFLITAFNVLAHTPNPSEFFAAARMLLEPNGLLVVEVPHLRRLIEYGAYDTIYHEHISYFLAKGLIHLGDKHDLGCRKIETTSMHGGSLRLWFRSGDNTITNGSEVDGHITKLEALRTFGESVHQSAVHARLWFEFLRSQEFRLAGFGAAAKGNVFLNYAKIGPDLLEVIFDDTPSKIGKLSPGMQIPITAWDVDEANAFDSVVILPWNFAKAAISRMKGYNGRFGIAIPSFNWIQP